MLSVLGSGSLTVAIQKYAIQGARTHTSAGWQTGSSMKTSAVRAAESTRTWYAAEIERMHSTRVRFERKRGIKTPRALRWYYQRVICGGCTVGEVWCVGGTVCFEVFS